MHEVEPEGVEVVSKGGGGAPPSPLGAVIHKRPAPEASCAPSAQDKKTIELVDPKSASVSAQDGLNDSAPDGKSVPLVRGVGRGRIPCGGFGMPCAGRGQEGSKAALL